MIKKYRYKALFIAAGVVFILVAIVSFNVIWAATVSIPKFGELHNRSVAKSTKIYDRTGKVLLYDTQGSMRRITVPLSEISPFLVKATIAIEDNNFYKHNGVRPNSVMRAMAANATSLSFEQGGSTITQQVVKNTLLTNNKSVIRKMKEWILAMRVEKRYSKDEILETYFNEIPYGGTIYGAEEASRAYFNKSAGELSLAEAAYIAALPKAPTYLSPWGKHREALDDQEKLVLAKMLEYGSISQGEYDEALKEKITFNEKSSGSIKAPHFVFYVLDELKKKYGQDVEDDGYQVITTLDWQLQKESEEIVHEGALQNEKNYHASNAGLVVIDPKTGQVLAMVGSRDYFDNAVDGQVNVTLASRQPGSTFKPFVYATAFKKGYTPETVIFDLKTQFSTRCAPNDFSSVYPCYSPENYDHKVKGPVTMRHALAQSLNIPGVKILYLAGVKDSINTARDMGITTLTDPNKYGLSLVLGGGAVSLLEMTSAYGGFANDGVWNKPNPILVVKSVSGRNLEEFEADPKDALDRDIARTINDILSDNIARASVFGTHSPMYFSSRVVAAKTGTSNDHRDMWVIGYTPDVVVGAWAGNNDNSPTSQVASAIILGPLWHKAMQNVLDHVPATTAFVPPSKNISVLPQVLASQQNLHASTTEVHEILYWMNKSDPQLALWEYPVSLWANQYIATSTNTNLANASLGTGGPDSATVPVIITAPREGTSVKKGQYFTVGVAYSNALNVYRVSYYVNDKLVGSIENAPYSIGIKIDNEGSATLKAVVEHSSGFSDASVNITAVR